MKLLIQSDDYGMTRGVARGAVHGIEHGLIRNTGVFANMPWMEECVSWIRPHLEQIAFGIDLNISTGTPLLSAEQVPTLVGEGGAFLSSWASRKLDAELGHDHADLHEAEAEFRAQIERFISVVGKKPDYISSHAYGTPAIYDLQRKLSDEYGLLYTWDVWAELMGPDWQCHIPWYQKPATLENQAASSLEQWLLEHGDELLARDVYVLVGHMGYVDCELMDLSTYTLYRPNDLAGVTSPAMLRWVEENGVELITYRDLARA